MVCRCSTSEEHAARAQAANLANDYSMQQREARKLREAGLREQEKANAIVEERDRLATKLAALTPDATNFEIIDIVEMVPHLVLVVRFPSCVDCSYEGDKVLVYRDTPLRDVVFWKKIDPHFSIAKVGPHAAPSPSARFPASDAGKKHAVQYVEYLLSRQEGNTGAKDD